VENIVIFPIYDYDIFFVLNLPEANDEKIFNKVDIE